MLNGKSKKIIEKKRFLRQMTPVIIMSRGHSGTRLLSWALNCLEIQMGVEENLQTGDVNYTAFTDKIKRIAIDNIGITSLEEIREKDSQRFQTAVLDYYSQLSSPSGAWGWKFPETYLIAPYVYNTFPEAYYIHMIRDGRDIAFKTHSTDNPKRKIGRAMLKTFKLEEYPHHLQAAISWANQVDNFDQFRKAVPEMRIFDLKFEDLCLKPVEVLKSLCKFLNLPLTDRCKEFLSSEANVDKVSQFRDNDSSLIKEVEQRIKLTLERYEYC